MTDVSRRPKILPYSPENYPKPLPTFSTDEELRNFWETHDVTYYLDEMEEVAFEDLPAPMQRLIELGPHPSTPKDPNLEPYETLVLRVPSSVMRAIEDIARIEKVSLRRIVGGWVEERAKSEQTARSSQGKRSA